LTVAKSTPAITPSARPYVASLPRSIIAPTADAWYAAATGGFISEKKTDNITVVPTFIVTGMAGAPNTGATRKNAETRHHHHKTEQLLIIASTIAA
jgi:hypothetical protein